MGVFAANGYRLADCQDIADQAGVGKGTVYRHFSTKEALFSASLREGMEQLREHVETAAARVEDPLAKLKAAFHAYLAFFDETPALIELILLERAEFRSLRTSMYFSYSEADRGIWLPLLQQLKDQGRLRVDEPDLALDTLGVIAFGSAVSDRLNADGPSLSDRAEQLFDIFQSGVIRD